MDASQLPAEAQEQQNKQFQISNFFKRLVPWTSKDGQINSVVAGWAYLLNNCQIEWCILLKPTYRATIVKLVSRFDTDSGEFECG